MGKEDPKQLLCGTLALEEVMKVDILKKRHPLAAQLLEEVSTGRYAGTIGNDRREADQVVTMNEVLNELDAQVIIAMVDSEEKLNLEWRYVSENDRRLCFVRRKEGKNLKVHALALATPSVFNEDTEGGKEETPPTNVEGKEAEADTKNARQIPTKKGKKLNTTLRSLKFKKNSFSSKDTESALPLGVGDVVTCDIYQYRQTGAFVVENIKVLERKTCSHAAAGKEDVATPAQKLKGLTGFVTEVLPSRQFGFIAQVDEDSAKRGKDLFFHLSQVEVGLPGGSDGNGANETQDGSDPLSPLGRHKIPGRSDAVGSVIRKGDEVRFNIGKSGKNGKPTATKIIILPRGTLKMAPINNSKTDSSQMSGYILMEPSHTSFVNTPTHTIAPQSGPSTSTGAVATGGGSRWDNVRDDAASTKNYKSESNEGVILLLSDPSGLFSPKPKATESPKKGVGALLGEDLAFENSGSNVAEASSTAAELNNAEGTDATSYNAVKEAKTNDDTDSTKLVPCFVAGTHLRYKTSSIMTARGFSSVANSRHNNDGPRRGDLVTFSKFRGVKLVKDIRIEKPNAATRVKGVLTDICKEKDTAVFAIYENEKETRYDIRLTDVVSCDQALLKDKEQADGILHKGRIFGVCRMKDIYLESSFSRISCGSCGAGNRPKERPKLNLTVKKELQGMGGKIMAQSQMAKGPISGTNGFAPGWTTRVTAYCVEDEDEAEEEEEEEEEEEKEEKENVVILKSKEAEEQDISRSLSAAASEFVPNI